MADLNAPADAIITLLKTLPGLADEAGVLHVHKGVPASLPARLSVYVALADLLITERATQLQEIGAVYAVNFGYRVEANVSGASTTAETALMTAVLAFVQAMRLAVNRRLSSTVENATLSTITGARPEYAIIAGQEFRILGMLVTTAQYHTY